MKPAAEWPWERSGLPPEKKAALFKEWTNQHLDALDREREARGEAQYAEADPNGEAHLSTHMRFVVHRWPLLIREAIKSEDIEALVKLTDNEERRRFAFKEIFRPRGRRAGEHRPTDRDEMERELLAHMAADVDRIRQFWRNQGIRGARRIVEPEEIAVERVLRASESPQISEDVWRAYYPGRHRQKDRFVELLDALRNYLKKSRPRSPI